MNHNHNFYSSLSLSQISHSLSLSPAGSLSGPVSQLAWWWSMICKVFFVGVMTLKAPLVVPLSPLSLLLSLSLSFFLPPAKRALGLIFNMSADRTTTTKTKKTPRPLGQCWWLLFLWQTCRHLSTNLYKNRFVYRLHLTSLSPFPSCC